MYMWASQKISTMCFLINAPEVENVQEHNFSLIVLMLVM